MTDIKVTIRRAASYDAARRISFKEIAESILGKNYELSLVICGDTLARHMYLEHRLPALKLRQPSKNSYSSNVLSFPLSKSEGEIFLNVRKAEREAKAMGISSKERIAHLFVHGCFHLKGIDHSDAMECDEARIMKRFGFNS